MVTPFSQSVYMCVCAHGGPCIHGHTNAFLTQNKIHKGLRMK